MTDVVGERKFEKVLATAIATKDKSGPRRHIVEPNGDDDGDKQRQLRSKSSEYPPAA